MNINLAWEKYTEAYALKDAIQGSGKCPHFSFILSRFAVIYVYGIASPSLDILQDLSKAYEYAKASIDRSTPTNNTDVLHNFAGQIAIIQGNYTIAQDHFESSQQHPSSTYYLARLLFHLSKEYALTCMDLCR